MVRLTALLILFFSVGALAQTNDIYRVETQVANQSEAERVAAAQATLGDVIVGITGDANALQNPMIKQAITEAPNYLNKFSYATDVNTKTGVKLVLNYSPQAVTKLLQQAQLAPSATSSQQGLSLQINNVATFGDFKKVQAYLKTIGLIRKTDLISVNKDTMLFNVSLDVDVALLKTTLAASGKLQAVELATALPADGMKTEASKKDGSNMLVYSWQKQWVT